jgi:hypothetical protein
MLTILLLSLCMTAGVIVRGSSQYVLYPELRSKQSGVPKAILGILAVYGLIIGVGLFGWILRQITHEPTFTGTQPAFPAFLLNAILAFPFAAVGEGNKRAGYLPLVTEWSLLLWNIVFVYIVSSLLPLRHVLWIPIGLASLLSLAHLATRHTLPAFLQGLSYIWYSTMVIGMGVIGILSFQPLTLHENTIALSTRATGAFFIGTIMCTLVLSCWYYLWSTLPFVFYFARQSSVMRANVASRFSDRQAMPWQAGVSLVLIAGLLICNRAIGMFSDWVIVGLLFTFFPFMERLLGYRRAKKTKDRQ